MGLTPSPPRWPPGVTSGWQQSIPRPARRCCACSPKDAKTWSPSVPERSTASTGFYETSCPAGYPERSRPPPSRPHPARHTAQGASARIRRRLASEVLRDIRTLERKVADLNERIETEVEASATSLIEIFGIGPILAAKIMGTG